MMEIVYQYLLSFIVVYNSALILCEHKLIQYCIINLTIISMSLSRKKMCCDEMPLFSVTQKLRLNAHLKGGFKRPCCGKQNEGKESKQPKNKQVKQRTVHDENRSLRKQRKKKYLQQEIQRIKQHQQLDENIRFAPFQEYSASEISVLKEDMREMKDVISKLTIQERRDQKQDPPQAQLESDKVCANLKNQISELQEQLQIQRETNFKLEEAHIQSQLYAKQTAQLSQSIRQELSDLANKHLSCQQTYGQLQQQKEIIKQLNQELDSCRKTIFEQQIKRQSLSKGMVQEMKKSQERLIVIKQLQKEKEQLSLLLQNTTHQFEEEKNKLTKIQLQVTTFHEEKKSIQQQKQILQEQCQKLQEELKQASSDLRDTRFKLGSLGSMEQKCQELYEEIKRERLKWSNTTLQEQLRKQKLDMDLNILQNQRDKLLEQIEILNKKQLQVQETSEQLKVQNKRLFEDRVNLAKQNRNLEIRINQVQIQLQQTLNQNQQLINKNKDQQSSFQQQKSKWLKEKEKIQTRLEWLSKQKTAIEQQVNGTLEAVKRRHDDILMRNSELQRQLNSVQQQKQSELETAQASIDKITKQNEMYKTILGQKQLSIIQQQVIITNSQQEVNQLHTKVKQTQNSAQQSKLQWQATYADTKVQLKNCQASLQLWKDKFEEQKNELTQRNQKIETLRAQSQIAIQHHSQLYHKIESVESQLRNSQSVRFELSEELSCLQDSTKRNTELIQQEKSLYEREINLKNKCISELKSTIKLVKDQSLRIMEQLERYREEAEATARRQLDSEIEMKYQQFSTLIQGQLLNLRVRIDDLTVQKNELERVLTFLRASNNELTDRIYKMSSDQQWQTEVEKQNNSLQQANRLTQQLREDLQKTNKLKEQYIKELEIKEKEIIMLHGILEDERKHFASQLKDKHSKIDLTQSILSQQSDTSQKLAKIIEEKDQTLKKLTERINMYEEKRIKIVNQVQTIQNRISELADKNTLLEQENKQLQQNLNRSEGQLRLTEERMKMILEHKLALQQQKISLEQHSSILKDQISRTKQQQQKSRKQFNEIIQIYQNRKGEAIGSLQAKIQQLANELSSSIQKLTFKNKQIEHMEQKCIKIQQVLEDNHQLLKQQRGEREKLVKVQTQLTTQIQNYKHQIANKQRQAQTSARNCNTQRQHLDELEAKLQSMKRKYEGTEHEKAMAQRQIENHQVSIRILREQNRNIQKVMSDQLLQRKSMIEQLINQKRMLYAQLHHE